MEMSDKSQDESLGTFRRLIATCGFDVVHDFKTDWYNQVKPSQLTELPANKPALLVGNSKALWPRFIQYYRENVHRNLSDPFDKFVEETFEIILKDAGENGVPPRVQLYFSHQFDVKNMVSFQKAAHVSGAAFLDEDVHLCVHRVFGPWFSLRVIVVFLEYDASETHPLQPPEKTIISLNPEELEEAKTHLQNGLMARKLQDPLAWKEFIAVRNAISYGKEHQYDPPQLLYHYTKSKDILKQAIT